MRVACAVVFALSVATAAVAQQDAADVAGDDAAPGIEHEVAAQPEPGAEALQSAEEARDSSARSKVKALGEGAEQLYAVEHAGWWSLHVENVPAAAIFALWHAVGGPSVASRQVLDFPFTMSVHRMTAQRIVARILDGYNYTLLYESGRLAEVHVVGAIPSRAYKTPRLVESRTQWTNTEIMLLTTGEPAPADKP